MSMAPRPPMAVMAQLPRPLQPQIVTAAQALHLPGSAGSFMQPLDQVQANHLVHSYKQPIPHSWPPGPHPSWLTC